MTAAGNTVVDLTPDIPTVELRGRRFRVREQGVDLLSLMKFATIAKGGIDSESLEGMAALYGLLLQCVHPEDWPAFEAHCADVGAKGQELMHLIRDAVQAAAGRPTQPPSPSPGGPPTTGPSSAASSSAPGSSPPIVQGDLRVQADLERRGRPDLALVVKRAGEASTTSSPR